MYSNSFLRPLFFLGSALLVVVLCILPSTKSMFPFWIIARGSFVMDTLFHELGHSIFGWLFGNANLPMIFTIFMSDKMGGMAMNLGHWLILQIAAFIGLAYLCYYLRYHWLFIPAVVFSVLILVIYLLGLDMLVIDYMGHGGSIAMGGFFLYRAFADIAKNKVERWLNAYFGFYLTLSNIFFCYQLTSDPAFLAEYMSPIDHIGHHDMVKVSAQLLVTIQSVATFTMIVGIVTVIGTAIASLFYTKAD